MRRVKSAMNLGVDHPKAAVAALEKLAPRQPASGVDLTFANNLAAKIPNSAPTLDLLVVLRF
jgi:hypothetical protein